MLLSLLSLTGLLALLAALYFVYMRGKDAKQGEINGDIIEDVRRARKASLRVGRDDSFTKRLWEKYKR